MSVLYENTIAVFISHEEYINKIYATVNKSHSVVSYQANKSLFNIRNPYVSTNREGKLTRKKKIIDNTLEFKELKCMIDLIKSTYEVFKTELLQNGIITSDVIDDENKKNKEALEFSEVVYKNTAECDIESIVGGNTRDSAICVKIKDHDFLFPKKCKFYCCNVNLMNEKLDFDGVYDLIVIDPPWWNKYIRRKRKKTNDAYNMMYNSELLHIPIESLIHDDSLIVVWCTNAKSNLVNLKEEIFKKWGVHYKATWFWLKVTTQGELICDFSEPPGKQPFEQILIASRNSNKFSEIRDRRLVVSVPSALHSNKPPLNEILSKFLPKNPKCLEIFARYLLPNTTSYGLEAIRFQHLSLYEEVS